ncbi:hypothetical protein EDE15_3549 [Edaphobacter aggregans]|uniref:Uncharacterized protein n=1 Tax=Edaphobacter aggregans TaxID=570835 RepID=A0A3R9R4W0_9BACT|nr:hypothetical protein [Edaphobacter aggregans]RSL17996.1 hypothetical protein EDE15_3549 [Edaphobacter aggregans]
MASTLTAAPLRWRRRYPNGDLAIKLRVSHLVESVDFEPRELPPASILIVRRLEDPMPRCLRGDPSALAPAPAWERAARSALSGIARQTARPMRDLVPSNANAVLFADEAELLACFSRDLLRGVVSSLWWWRTFLRSLPSAATHGLLEAWRTNIRSVPSALAHLSERREAIWVLSSFTPAHAWLILEEIACGFDLKFVVAARKASSGVTAELPVAGAGAAAHPVGTIPFWPSPQDSPLVVAPWHGVLADHIVSTSLGWERSALLGVSLLLCQSPKIVRSQEFARAFIRWRHSSIGPSYAMQTDVLEETNEPESGSRPQAVPPLIQLRRGDSNEGFDNVKSSALDGPDRHAHEGGSPNFDLAPELDPTCRATDTSTEREGLRAARGEGTEWGAEALQAKAIAPHLPVPGKLASQSVRRNATAAEVVEPVPVEELAGPIPVMKKSLAAGECVSTALGGVFFLINVLKALRLSQLLEQECGCQLGLGSWELIELIARFLLRSSDAYLAQDPLWALLLVLDGRPAEQKAGADFSPPDCYRIPDSWVPDDVTDRLEIRCCGRRLEVWNPLGFPQMVRYFDQPPSRATIEQELEKNGARGKFSRLRRHPSLYRGAEALDLALDRPLRRLLAFLMPFLRWRLAAGLGLGTAPRPDLAEALLLRVANVWVTSTHVDLMMGLNQVTAPVRCSGLDTDPGWVPELGRVVKFHFD